MEGPLAFRLREVEGELTTSALAALAPHNLHVQHFPQQVLLLAGVHATGGVGLAPGNAAYGVTLGCC
jgi:hypothetical protein